MNQFLCGCPIWFGVGLIILVNLVHNVFSIFCVTMNIVFKTPTFGANDPPAAQVFNAAWCLLGLPFIFAAIAGMWTKQESNMRLYLVYLATTFTMDLVFVLMWLTGSDVCSNMPRSLQRHGAAFACGFLRIFSVGFTVMLMIVFAYACYCVWSYCEDLKAGGSGRGLEQLMTYQEEKKMQSAYDTFTGSITSTVQNIHDSVAPLEPCKFKTVGGSERIKFGVGSPEYRGIYHETSYPPPVKQFRS